MNDCFIVALARGLGANDFVLGTFEISLEWAPNQRRPSLATECEGGNSRVELLESVKQQKNDKIVTFKKI